MPVNRFKKGGNISLKTILGAISGFVGFLVVALINSPWEELIVAALIGSVAGLVDKSKLKIMIGILSCAGGLFLGLLLTIVLGERLSLPLGAWGVAGAFLGMTFGIYDRSILRAIFGFILGFFGGLIAEASQFLLISIESLKLTDRQLIILISSGIFINLFTAFTQKK
jgi:hypothetical protein